MCTVDPVAVFRVAPGEQKKKQPEDDPGNQEDPAAGIGEDIVVDTGEKQWYKNHHQWKQMPVQRERCLLGMYGSTGVGSCGKRFFCRIAQSLFQLQKIQLTVGTVQQRDCTGKKYTKPDAPERYAYGSQPEKWNGNYNAKNQMQQIKLPDVFLIAVCQLSHRRQGDSRFRKMDTKEHPVPIGCRTSINRPGDADHDQVRDRKNPKEHHSTATSIPTNTLLQRLRKSSRFIPRILASALKSSSSSSSFS